MSKNAPTDIQALEATGLAVAELDAHMQGWRQWPIQVTGLSVRGPRTQGDEYLATVRGVDAEGVKCVAWHSAMSLGDLLRGVTARAKNGTLTWKIDEWAKD
jgi:hypothetical protein